MKRSCMVTSVAVLLSCSLFFSSCIGPFNLYNKVLTWTHNIGDKWANEVVFLACCIIPVIPVAWVVDAVVLNAVEFWGGDSSISDVQTKEIETESGRFVITSDANGHKIQKVGSDEIAEFRFNKEENSWSLVIMDEVTPLFRFTDDNQANVFLADGSTLTIDRNEAGLMALRQIAENKVFMAVK